MSSGPPAPGRPSVAARVTLALLLVAGLDVLSCSLHRRVAVEPVPARAARILGEARALLRASEDRGLPDAATRERIRRAAELALELDPTWIAPCRLLDDLDRRLLLGPQALAARLAELEADPSDARTLYLVGRLEGEDGPDRFRRASLVDDRLAWAHHGLAWSSFRAGDARGALAEGRRALDRARDPWEHAFFAETLARYLAAVGRLEEALELLRGVLDASDELAPGDRTELAVLLARLELGSDEGEDVRRGFRRAIELLRSPLVTEAEVVELATRVRRVENDLGPSVARAELEIALASATSPARDAVLAELLYDSPLAPLARELSVRARRDPALADRADDATTRARRLAAGERGAVLDDWLAGLPRRALDDDGGPRDAALRRLVQAAHAAVDPASSVLLGEALLAAGWYVEARGLAASLAASDLESALSLHRRAAAGIALFEEVETLVGRTDRGRSAPLEWLPADGDAARLVPAVEGSRRTSLEDLHALLAALQPFFERFPLAGEPVQVLTESPLVRYPPVAVIVHPGPTFSAEDEARGLGLRGDPVPGLALELARRGRFGIFGEALGGGGPDGTVLRRLSVEERSGEHLGVPFHGTAVLCDGTDVPSRPVRLGATIVGAALHEGYWVDVDGVRSDLRSWNALERRFLADPELAQEVLAQAGPRLPEGELAQRLAEGRLYASLDEEERVRLAVLVGRAAEGRPELVTLDELVEVTSLHEEGHLTDRTRFLPLAAHWRSVLRLAAKAGFSPRGIGELLEYRAQLVSLCTATDPRLPLADCLGSLEGETGGTPHASAYRSLLADWLDVAVERARAGEGPDLGPGYPLHALHRLSPEQVRDVSLALARREGLAR